MSQVLQNTAAAYQARIAQLDRQMENLKRQRDGYTTALDLLKPTLAKLPAPEAKAAKASPKAPAAAAS